MTSAEKGSTRAQQFPHCAMENDFEGGDMQAQVGFRGIVPPSFLFPGHSGLPFCPPTPRDELEGKIPHFEPSGTRITFEFLSECLSFHFTMTARRI